jgi:hypothetical protein
MPQNFKASCSRTQRMSAPIPPILSTRLYKTRAEQDFHTDGA